MAGRVAVMSVAVMSEEWPVLISEGVSVATGTMDLDTHFWQPLELWRPFIEDRAGRALAELDPSIASVAVDFAARNFTEHRIHSDLAGQQGVLEAWS